MNKHTARQNAMAMVFTILFAVVLLIASCCAIGVTWDIACDAIDCEIDAHGRSAFGDRYEPKETGQ